MRRATVLFAALGMALVLAAGGTAASRSPRSGDRLIIPRLHLNDRIGSSIDLGPAFYPGSGRPGEPYTIAIAGHRTTHTHPFWSLDLLTRGDRIVIVSHGLRHVYVVSRSRVVDPTDWSIARERGYERVILTTCTPRFSARERLVVFASVARTTHVRS
jgi:LPXTG-site transpeptidase (sortase) family protein